MRLRNGSVAATNLLKTAPKELKMGVIFQENPDVYFGGNIFRNCQTIIQHEDIPLLEVGKFEPAGYSIRYAIYHSDGTKIAVVNGARIHLTKEGKKAKIKTRNPKNMTVCEVEGKPILELHRDGAAAMKGWAQLYAPTGVLIRAVDSGVTGGLAADAMDMEVVSGGGKLRGLLFEDFPIAIRVIGKNIRIGFGSTSAEGRIIIGSPLFNEPQPGRTSLR